jgi:hypothetical protein
VALPENSDSEWVQGWQALARRLNCSVQLLSNYRDLPGCPAWEPGRCRLNVRDWANFRIKVTRSGGPSHWRFNQAHAAGGADIVEPVPAPVDGAQRLDMPPLPRRSGKQSELPLSGEQVSGTSPEQLLGLAPHQIEKIDKVEAAIKKRIANMVRRGQLVERTAVSQHLVARIGRVTQMFHQFEIDLPVKLVGLTVVEIAAVLRKEFDELRLRVAELDLDPPEPIHGSDRDDDEEESDGGS